MSKVPDEDGWLPCEAVIISRDLHLADRDVRDPPVFGRGGRCARLAAIGDATQSAIGAASKTSPSAAGANRGLPLSAVTWQVLAFFAAARSSGVP
jgi:hypothetical protein